MHLLERLTCLSHLSCVILFTCGYQESSGIYFASYHPLPLESKVGLVGAPPLRVSVIEFQPFPAVLGSLPMVGALHEHLWKQISGLASRTWEDHFCLASIES